MPLHSIIDQDPKWKMAVWKVEENREFFLKQLLLTSNEVKNIEAISKKPRLVLEFLTSRFLIHKLDGSNDRIDVLKDKYGKPFLKDDSRYISLSHGWPFVAVIISDIECGIDVQEMKKKIIKVMPRVASKKELKILKKSKNPLVTATQIWCAKEAIYKAYGKKGLDLSEQIHIKSFKKRKDKYQLSGKLLLEQKTTEYDLMAAHPHKNYILMTAFKKQ